MAVGTIELPEMHPVAGVRIGVAEAGIRYKNRRDLTVFEIAEGATTAGVFTRNAFCAAPVQLCRQHLQQTSTRYLLINTGNANAGTGERGMANAQASCEALAALTGVAPAAILPFSTGVIGEHLPIERVTAGLPAALAALTPKGWDQAAFGIMTTDTKPKGASVRFEWDGKPVTVTGISKGAGMIRPNMATMLGFVATDAGVPQALLHTMLTEAVDGSFNRITIDGDTSTNDSCILVATGQSGVQVATLDDPFALKLREVLCEVFLRLAQLIVRDGEGATKFIAVQVEGGRDTDECCQIAYAVAHSPLIKTAFFACDPNWGRILAAVGYAGVPDLDVGRIQVYLDEVQIVENGGTAPSYREELGAAVMKRPEITIRIVLGRGEARDTVWTCDLSYDYVKINADYRS